MPASRLRITAYTLAGLLAGFEFTVLAFALNPTVTPTYRARYIDGTSDCWEYPASGEYELGITMQATLALQSPGLRDLLRCGWLATEPSGTWTRGGETQIRFHLDGPRQDLLLELEIAPFAVEFGLTQRVIVSAGGTELQRVTLDTRPPSRHLIPVPATLPLDPDGNLDITLFLPDAATPKSVGINNDTRSLAIRLISLRLAPA